jgi:hypothetical protein
VVNDELELSLHLDGRLPPDRAEVLARRLEAEPELRARFETMQRLQALSAGLGFAQAEFTADDVRRRRTGRTWWRAAAAVAAVALLALTHGSAFLLGTRRAPAPEVSRTPLDETEDLLARAARIDPAAPPAELRSQLIGLRERIRPLPDQLSAWKAPAAPQRRRAAEYADALIQLELAFEEVSDPAFRAVAVASIARSSLEGELPARFLPATAQSYARADPLGGGRFRIVVVRPVDGIPRLLVDEGTPTELEERHEGVRFIHGEGD